MRTQTRTVLPWLVVTATGEPSGWYRPPRPPPALVADERGAQATHTRTVLPLLAVTATGEPVRWYRPPRSHALVADEGGAEVTGGQVPHPTVSSSLAVTATGWP